MARRRMTRRSGGKNRYSWHGFYMNTVITPADILLDVFKLYDPIDGDHNEEVVLQRTVIHMQCKNPDTVASGRIGFGLYLVERNAAGAMVSDCDPLGISSFDIEANWQLWHKNVDMSKHVSGQQPQIHEYEFNSKAKRKIEDPQMLVMLVRGDTASRWNYMFQARCLIKEGRF